MPSIGQFLIARLKHCGVNHIMSLPGDYSLRLTDMINSSDIELVGNTDEQCSGFAADAYARVNGIGCVLATYCVGGFKLLNPIAGAFAEKSPVIVICGAPGVKEKNSKMLLHHAIGNHNAQRKIFEHVTCASTVLDNPVTAGYEIDRVMMALNRYKQPVYIEVPRDMVDTSINYDAYVMGSPKPMMSDATNLNEVLSEVVGLINSSKNPVILAGIELARFGFGEIITKFAKRYNIPVATTLLSKSLVNEKLPIALGVYCGEASNADVRRRVEESDCLIMLGVMLTDVNFGFKPVAFRQNNIVFCTTEKMSVKNHNYDDVLFQDFVNGLISAKIEPKNERFSLDERVIPSFVPNDSKVTVKRLFEKINSILDKKMAVIADVGDSLFGSNELIVHHSNHFLAQAFYTSMGFSIPAAVGVQKAKPDVRPLVLVGDGAFQMTGMDVSTIAKHGLNPIIIVLNNGGYTVERFLIDGSFNDIHNWQYHKITDVIGYGKGLLVNTEKELDCALNSAVASKELYIINVILGKKDRSVTLERMTSKLQKIV